VLSKKRHFKRISKNTFWCPVVVIKNQVKKHFKGTVKQSSFPGLFKKACTEN